MSVIIVELILYITNCIDFYCRHVVNDLLIIIFLYFIFFFLFFMYFICFFFLFFFFQAEDGIRDKLVTGVQTCALPIFVAAGVYPSPIPHADVVTTTTHKTLRGPRGGLILCKAEHAKAIDKAVFPGTQGGPLEHVIAAKAVAFKEALDPSFKSYCAQIIANAQTLSKALSGFGFQIVSGGTDNHLMLVDLRSKNLTGKVAEKA